jgi:hypothetical protein
MGSHVIPMTGNIVIFDGQFYEIYFQQATGSNIIKSGKIRQKSVPCTPAGVALQWTVLEY